jgi:hypothetical protein
MNQEIILKDFDVLEGLMKGVYPSILIIMASEVISMIRAFNKKLVLTSSFREGDPGVHGSFRGLDFRTHELRSSEIENIVEKINSRYIYDPKRPEMKVLMYHDIGKGLHLHLQSHPNTVRV